MRLVVFVRHGKSEANVKNILSSDVTPYHLTTEGISQIQLAAHQIAKVPRVDNFYTSPILRATESAKIIENKIKIAPKIDKRLSERFMGKFNNKTFASNEDLRLALKNEIDSGYKNGVESWEKLSSRMKDFLDSLKPNTITLAVSHYDPILAATALIDTNIRDLSFNVIVPNASITVLDLEEQRVICIGRSSLPELSGSA